MIIKAKLISQNIIKQIIKAAVKVGLIKSDSLCYTGGWNCVYLLFETQLETFNWELIDGYYFVNCLYIQLGWIQLKINLQNKELQLECIGIHIFMLTKLVY